MVRHDGDPSAVAFASLETVGRGGALLRCTEPIPAAPDAELTICLAGGVIRARSRVLYQIPEEDGLGVGVEFLELLGDSGVLLEHLVEPEPDEAAPDPPPALSA